MKYAILALGLLISPAQAEEFTKPECASLQEYFDVCTEPCDGECPTGRFYSRSGVHDVRIQHDMPGAGGFHDRIDDACEQIRGHKLTARAATKQFCPHGGRPDRGEWYDHECSTMANYFGNCAAEPDPDRPDLACDWYRGDRPLSNWLWKLKERHHLTDDGLKAVCQQVCDHKLTAREATGKFCP
jgi:hypothetical protein